MDRRKFFRIFGGVTAAPFVPFKWEVGKGSKTTGPTGTGDGGVGGKGTTGETGRPYIEPSRLFIGKDEYTNKCYALEITQDVEFVDITGLGDEYRRFARPDGVRRIRLNVDLHGYHDLDRSVRHEITVVFKDATILTMKARLSYSHSRYEVGNIAKTRWEFWSDELPILHLNERVTG